MVRTRPPVAGVCSGRWLAVAALTACVHVLGATRAPDTVELLNPFDGARVLTVHPRFEWTVSSGVPATHT